MRVAPPPWPLAAAALVLVAGCAAPPAAPGGDPAAPGPGPAGEGPALALPWELLECRFVYATAQVPASRVRPLLPEGFAPRTASGAPGLPEDLVAFNLEADDCRAGSGLDGSIAGMQYAMFSVPVVPPEALRVANATSGHYVTFAMLVPDAPRREALAARGLHVHAGSVAIEDTPLPGGDLRRTATASLDGFGTFVLDAVATGVSQGIGGHFVDYSAGEGGLLRMRVDWATSEFFVGAATVQVPPGSWVAEVLGAQAQGVRALAGTWSYTNGTMEFPAAPQPAS